MTIDKKLSL